MTTGAGQHQPVALVTGGSGFVGARLVRALASDGWTVHALTRPGGRRPPADARAIEAPGTASALAAIFERVRPTAIFHLATLFRGRHSTQDIEALVEANVLLGTQVAEAASRVPPQVLVNVGTAWQRGEEGDYAPAALYAATKQAMEDILRFYASADLLRISDVKLFDTYGPDDPRGKLLSLLHAASRSGRTLQMSPGEQLIDLLHVDDVVRALRTAAETAGGPWASWAASSGEARTLREVVALFERSTGRRVPVEWGALPYRQREMFEPWAAGPPVPGWAPRISLAEGIAQVWGGDAT